MAGAAIGPSPPRGRALSRGELFAMKRAARSPVVEARVIALVTRNLSPVELLSPRNTLALLRA